MTILAYDDTYMIIITESWLVPSITNNMLDPDHQFSIYRNDRSPSIGGGVCVFIHSSIKCHEIQLSDEMLKLRSESGCEMLCFDIILTATRHRVILVYRPPNLHMPKLSQQSQLSA